MKSGVFIHLYKCQIIYLFGGKRAQSHVKGSMQVWTSNKNRRERERMRTEERKRGKGRTSLSMNVSGEEFSRMFEQKHSTHWFFPHTLLCLFFSIFLHLRTLILFSPFIPWKFHDFNENSREKERKNFLQFIRVCRVLIRDQMLHVRYSLSLSLTVFLSFFFSLSS